MKPVLRYQSQLLYRKSYKPGIRFRFRPRGGLRARPVHLNGWKASAFPVAIERDPSVVLRE